MRGHWSGRPAEPTLITWGCGHQASTMIAVEPLVALEQIEAYTQIDCTACSKAKKIQTRGITWADVNRSR